MTKTKLNAYIYLLVGIINLISASFYFIEGSWQGWLFIIPGLIWVFIGYKLLRSGGDKSKQIIEKESK